MQTSEILINYPGIPSYTICFALPPPTGNLYIFSPSLSSTITRDLLKADVFSAIHVIGQAISYSATLSLHIWKDLHAAMWQSRKHKTKEDYCALHLALADADSMVLQEYAEFQQHHQQPSDAAYLQTTGGDANMQEWNSHVRSQMLAQ